MWPEMAALACSYMHNYHPKLHWLQFVGMLNGWAHTLAVKAI